MATIEYQSDGGVDFFKELKKIKCASPATPATPAIDTPRCLITDEPLRKDHITLRCGHKFNYVPLFKEVLFQKCSLLPKNLSSSIVTMYMKNTPIPQISSLPVFSSAAAAASAAASAAATAVPPNLVSVTYNSSYNLETTKLQYNEMKCPYCRTITQHILPYYPYSEVCKVKYVNMPPNLALPGLSCEYRPPANGKGASAGETSSCKSGCVYSEKYDMMLCNKHLNKKDAEQDVATKESKGRTKKQQSVSDDAMIVNTTENVIVSHHNPATAVCQFVLLSGARKGTPCGKPIWIPKTTQPAATPELPSKAYCKAHWGK